MVAPKRRADPEFVRSILSAAVELAEGAGALTLSRFGTVLSADAKEDGSPVTVVDREAEAFLRDGIRKRFPGHAIVGEEHGEERGSEPVRWILDPIDGTRSFMRGVPLYAILVGVEIEDDPTVGVVVLPALGETVAAAKGLGATWKRPGSRARRPDAGRAAADVASEPASVSRVGDLAAAMVLTTSPRSIRASGIGAGWDALVRAAGDLRGWGDAYGHVLVATGRADVMVDAELHVWDAAPLLPILPEAGGKFTDLGGRETIRGGAGVSTNGRLHPKVLEVLAGRPAPTS